MISGAVSTHDHALLLEIKEMRICGCACGWKASGGSGDPEKDFSTHLASTRIAVNDISEISQDATVLRGKDSPR